MHSVEINYRDGGLVLQLVRTVAGLGQLAAELATDETVVRCHVNVEPAITERGTLRRMWAVNDAVRPYGWTFDAAPGAFYRVRRRARQVYALASVVMLGVAVTIVVAGHAHSPWWIAAPAFVFGFASATMIRRTAWAIGSHELVEPAGAEVQR